MITLRGLKRKLADASVSEADLRPYVEVDPKRSHAFAPSLRINPDMVDDEGLEGDFFVGSFNATSRKRRKERYRDKIARGYMGPRIVSEGDSWFQYPILLDDVVDVLSKEYAVWSLGGAGHTLSEMIDQDEVGAALERVTPSYFLISGGGNDMVGDGRLATMLHPFAEGRDPRDYPNALFQRFLSEVTDHYRSFFNLVLNHDSDLTILCHGYDWAIPDRGKWLGKPMKQIGIRDRSLQRDVTRVLIDRFNGALVDLTSEFDGRVVHVDCRGAVARRIGTMSCTRMTTRFGWSPIDSKEVLNT